MFIFYFKFISINCIWITIWHTHIYIYIWYLYKHVPSGVPEPILNLCLVCGYKYRLMHTLSYICMQFLCVNCIYQCTEVESKSTFWKACTSSTLHSYYICIYTTEYTHDMKSFFRMEWTSLLRSHRLLISFSAVYGYFPKSIKDRTE